MVTNEDRSAVLIPYPTDPVDTRLAARCAARQVIEGKLSMEDLRTVLLALGIGAEQLAG